MAFQSCVNVGVNGPYRNCVNSERPGWAGDAPPWGTLDFLGINLEVRMYVLGCEKCSVDVLVWVFLQLVLITLHFITSKLSQCVCLLSFLKCFF